MLVVQSLEAFSQTGFGASLVQKKGQVTEYLDSAWTVGIIRACLLYLLLFFIVRFNYQIYKLTKTNGHEE